MTESRSETEGRRSATALENATRSLEEARLLLASHLDPPRLAQRFLEILIDAFGAARGSLLMTNRRTGRLRVVAGVGLPSSVIGLDLGPTRRRISDWVLRERQALILNGPVRDRRFDSSDVGEHIESALCLPLHGAKDTIGVANLARVSPAPAFVEADLLSVERFTRPLAGMLEEVEEVFWSRDSWRRMWDEALHAGVLGPTTWTAPGQEVVLVRVRSPLMRADIAERVLHDDGSQSLLAADVAGEGAIARAHAALTRGLFLGLAQYRRSPAETARIMNAELCRREGEDVAASLWLALLSPNGQLVSCTAGFPAPACIPADGGRGRRLEAGGPRAGVVADAQYLHETVQLLPGDRVLVVSDGVLDASDAAGEPFGFEQVEATAREQCHRSLDQMASAICEAALSFTGAATPVDDLMVLAARFSRDN